MIRLISFFLILSLATPAFAQDLGFKEAAARYGASIPHFAEILEGISDTESKLNPNVLPAKNERISKKTGKLHVSYDHTHMQINDHCWKDKIGQELWEAMIQDPKIATMIGAWILSQNFVRYGNYKDAIAAYNTGRRIDLEDCLKATPSYQAGGPISDEDMASARARVERGRGYTLKVYNYMVKKGYLQPSPTTFVGAKQEPASVSVKVAQRQPRRQVINVAEFRKHGGWRKLQ